ncbi:TPA: SGNH/GDSL hydrolase family protein [Bacillus tropicus]|nr:SGNH/GDSL hydrolase family protein [Bacillus tropicus]
MADVPHLLESDKLWQGVPKINAAIDKANEALEETQKPVSYKKIDESVTTDVINLNTKDINLIDIKNISKATNGSIMLVRNNLSAPFSYTLVENILRLNYSITGASTSIKRAFISAPYTAIEKEKQAIAGFWVNKSDIDKAGVFFAGFIIIKADGSWTNDPDSLVSFDIKSSFLEPGYSLSRTNLSGSVAATLRVKAENNNWYFVEITCDKLTVDVTTYPNWGTTIGIARLGGNNIDLIGKLDVQNYTMLNTNASISPFRVYPLDVEDYVTKELISQKSMDVLDQMYYPEVNELADIKRRYNVTVTDISNDNSPIEKRKLPYAQQLLFSMISSSNGYLEYKSIQYEKETIPRTKIWLNKDDLNRISGKNPIRFYLINTDENGEWSTTEHVAYTQYTLLDDLINQERTGSNSTNTFNIKTRKIDEKDGWICIEWYMSKLPKDKYYWKPLFAIQKTEGNEIATIRTLDFTAVNGAKNQLQSLLVYPKPQDGNRSRWYGKTWTPMGDSMTEPANLGILMKYHVYIKNEKRIAEVNTWAQGGRTIAFAESAPTRQDYFCKSYLDIPYNSDIFTIFAGVNDYIKGVPLGTFDDRTENTFYGACHILFKGMIEKYPTKTLAYFTPLQEMSSKGTNSKGHKLIDYVDAAKAVAAFYSIPVHDQYRACGLALGVEAVNSIYTVDKLHPNEAGHERIAKRMSAFIETL